MTSWPEVNGSITEWVVLPLWATRKPFQEIYVLEGPQKMIKTKSGVKLWFSFHLKSLKPVGKPNKAECLCLSTGKMAAAMTHAEAFIWGSVLLSVCSLLAFI